VYALVHNEDKFWDQEGVYNARDTPSIYDISTVPQGFNPWERQGNYIRVNNVFLRMTYQPSYSQLDGQIRPMLCRAIMYIDKACKGVSGGTATDLLNTCQVTNITASPDDLYNPHTVPARYEILHDDMFVLAPLRGTASAGLTGAGSSYAWQNSIAPTPVEVGYDNYGPEIERLWNRAANLDTNIAIQYASGSPNPAESNQLKFLLLSEDPDVAARGWNVTWKTRITFNDDD